MIEIEKIEGVKIKFPKWWQILLMIAGIYLLMKAGYPALWELVKTYLETKR